MSSEREINEKTKASYEDMKRRFRPMTFGGSSRDVTKTPSIPMRVGYVLSLLAIYRFVSPAAAIFFLFLGLIVLFIQMRRETEIKKLDETPFYDDNQIPWDDES